MNAIDPATGMPLVPSGFFFRIERFTLASSSYTVRVELRKRRRFGSVSVENSLADHKVSGDVLRAAFRCLGGIGNASLTKYDGRALLLGDYPPKRLDEGEVIL